MNKIILKDDDATNKFGQLIASKILALDKRSIEIHLEGDLGSGKTFLTRSIIKSFGWSDHVKSPTYTLCEEYELGDLIFLHIDLYRTNEPEDILLFDLERNTHSKKVIVIEWPERLTVKRKFDIKISFKHINNGRELNIATKINSFEDLINEYN